MQSKVRNVFYSQETLWLSGHLRSPMLLKIIRAIPNSSAKRYFSKIFDPNLIRKRVVIDFQQKLIQCKFKNDMGTYFVDINDHVGYQSFLNKEFDSNILKIASCLGLSSGDVLLDIGANTGLVSIPFAKYFGVEVIGVEASPSNSLILLKNVQANSVNFKLHSICAVGPELKREHAYIPFYSKNGNNGASSIYKDWNKSRVNQVSEEVKTAMLDDLLEPGEIKRIKMIKLDVEGAEEEVLKGFSKIVEIDAPLFFEFRIDLMSRDLDNDGSGFVFELRKNFVLFGLEFKGSEKASLIPFDNQVSMEMAIGLPIKHFEKYKEMFD